MSPNPPRIGTPAAYRQGVLTAACLATVVTLHLSSGLLVDPEMELDRRLQVLAQEWWSQMLVSAAMLAMMAWRYRRVPAQEAGRALALARVVAWTAAAGLAVQLLVALGRVPHIESLWQGLGYGWIWCLSLSCLLVLGHDFAERSRAAADALHEAGLRQLTLARELDGARLQLLQAQVEPHFLFNALANVRRLLRTEPANSQRLLADLLRYLQEALPALRDEHTTLGREAELVRAFLAVHQVRMGPRLQAEIDIPPELASRTVPPMVLLTLVENALKHGLQPLVDGGSVQVRARGAGGRLTLTVADTGRGMGSGSGGGTGLANLRARLRSVHGTQARLSLAVNEPRGVIVTVELPAPGAGAPP